MSTWPQGMTVRPLPMPGERRDRDRSNFSAPWASTLELLDRELYNLGARNVVLQIDVTEGMLRIDGLPRANAVPATPAVALAFDSDQGPLRYACDRFTDWRDNLRAIALGLEALRKIDRYGIGSGGEQYKGWKALPSAPSGETPRQVLARHAQRDEPDIATRLLYTEAVRRTHPDTGGSAEAFAEVQAARAALEAGGQW